MQSPAAPEKLAEFLNASNRPALIALKTELARVPWEREAIASAIKGAAAQHGLKAPQVMMPLRMLVAGTPTTPSIDAVLLLIGRDKVQQRMAAGLDA